MPETTSPSKESLTKAATRAIDSARGELGEISRDIHSHPELNYQEHYAADRLSGVLERHGFVVERGLGGVETAFRGTLEGNGGGPTVAILAEYDALPEIGHGCGHNLIATSAMGAGLGIQANLPSLPGRMVVIGTPAEEGGGGKIRLIDAGVFDDVDVTLSSHPSSNRTVIPTEIPIGESWSLAMVGFRYIYHGKASHAAAAPEAGINALNAVIHLFTGIDAMRQHLRDDVRIHGVITDGGKAPNVVPEFAAANFMLRCRDRNYLSEVVVDRVREAAEGAALMTGARLEVQEFYPFYENVRPNGVLAEALRSNALTLGIKLDDPPPGRAGSGCKVSAYNASDDLIDRNIKNGRGDKVAVIDRDGAHSYEQLRRRINRFARLLEERNVERGQRIVLCLLDTVDFPTCFLGAIKAGIVAVPVNTMLKSIDKNGRESH